MALSISCSPWVNLHGGVRLKIRYYPKPYPFQIAWMSILAHLLHGWYMYHRLQTTANQMWGKVQGVFNRNKHRGNVALSNVTRKLKTMSTVGSDDLRSPPTTPRGHGMRTLTDLFHGDMLPSPPREGSDKSLIEVHRELDIVYPGYADLRDSEDALENEKYMKLAYAVGKGFFTHLLSYPRHDHQIAHAKGSAAQIVDMNTLEGERFHVMYSAYDQDDRMWTLEENKKSAHPIHNYEHYVKMSLLPHVSKCRASHPEQIYEVFEDESHRNMEPFYRCQQQANCFAHAAIVLHFYLQLFYDQNLQAGFAYLVNLSRFLRNMYSGLPLFAYIVYNAGDTFQKVLNKLMPNANLMEEYGDMSFEGYVDKLKRHGPAVVSMSVGPDFKNNNQWDYKGTRPDHRKEELEDHGMLLVGIVKTGDDLVVGNDVHFILQNFWQSKQFVTVRRDYFRSSKLRGGETRASFHWVTSQPSFENPESVYASPAGDVRVSLSSHLLERPIGPGLLSRR